MISTVASPRPSIWVTAVASLALCVSATAQTLTALHNFSGATNDGAYPYDAGLLSLGGKLYGDAGGGGAYGDGVVYELNPQSNGTWELSVLYSFTGGGPVGSLIADATGNLYGVTNGGGTRGTGTAYRLSRTSGGTWRQTLLWSFGGAGDGDYPNAGLVFDKSGNLYGTTVQGGAKDEGVVFELSPSSTGTWTEKVLHSFGDSTSDGTKPYASLIIDSAGNLYGTTAGGGSTNCDPEANGCGTVFELSPGVDGWSETVIHYFQNGTDGFFPLTPLVMDKEGDLYGTTTYGGDGSDQCDIGIRVGGCGTVFKLTRSSGGTWTEQILYAFAGGTGDSEPDSGVAFDSAGNIYGETAQTIQFSGAGAVYELTQSASGNWEFNMLVDFNGTDGSYPQGGLIVVGDRVLGTTNAGGAGGEGVVFEITP
jgi:uncharacterized repeat protein (TIGR03803 family)